MCLCCADPLSERGTSHGHFQPPPQLETLSDLPTSPLRSSDSMTASGRSKFASDVPFWADCGILE